MASAEDGSSPEKGAAESPRELGLRSALAIAGQVRNRRLDAGWTQADLATRADMPLPTYRKFERTGAMAAAGVFALFHALGLGETLESLAATPSDAPRSVRKRGRARAAAMTGVATGTAGSRDGTYVAPARVDTHSLGANPLMPAKGISAGASGGLRATASAPAAVPTGGTAEIQPAVDPALLASTRQTYGFTLDDMVAQVMEHTTGVANGLAMARQLAEQKGLPRRTEAFVAIIASDLERYAQSRTGPMGVDAGTFATWRERWTLQGR